MMDEHGKSDRSVVPRKRRTKPGDRAAEAVEGRGRGQGKRGPSKHAPDAEPGKRAQALERVRQAAKRDRKQRFTALLHHVDVERLRAAFLALKRDAAAGVDGVTWQQYGEGARGQASGPAPTGCSGERTGRSRRGGRTSRRRTGGSGRSASPRWRTRSSSGRVVEVLNAIYEADFLGFSLRVPAGAQSASMRWMRWRSGSMAKKVNWVLDADIRASSTRSTTAG